MANGQTALMRLMTDGEPQNVKTRKRTLNQTKHLYNNRAENRACATNSRKAANTAITETRA